MGCQEFCMWAVRAALFAGDRTNSQTRLIDASGTRYRRWSYSISPATARHPTGFHSVIASNVTAFAQLTPSIMKLVTTAMCGFLVHRGTADNSRVKHRGPDCTSVLEKGPFTFVHNLLAVTGAFTTQPFVSDDIVC